MKSHNRFFYFFILIVLVLISLGITPPLAAAAESTVCIPSCDSTDSRMLSLASVGYETLAGQSISLRIAAPGMISSFQLGIFDGDSGGMWDMGTTPLVYTLYADPSRSGEGLIELNQWLGSNMADNVWTDIVIGQDARAMAPSGDYFYQVRISLPNAASIKTWSNFKVRSDAPIELAVGESFAYAATLLSMADVSVVYPQYPALTPSTYDGTWDMYVNVSVSTPNFLVYDGDMDYGSFDCSINDTNDPDTPDDALPTWVIGISDALEGVATATINCRNSARQPIIGPQGQVYTTGNPADDNVYTIYTRPPALTYEITDPNENVYLNSNPSGNREWEQFRIESDPTISADYYVDALLPAGIYHVRIIGLDMTNLNAWHFNYDQVCVHEDGTPCVPVLHAYRIGDIVWYDANGNGIQDVGESGIAGVTVTLLDVNGKPMPKGTTTTDANGYYFFGVDAGTYSVRIDTSNFASGGALAGYFSTTLGGNTQTYSVTADNVFSYDFGYKSINYCSYIRSPGFWKNYSNHMSDATFLNLISHTQDFSYLSVSQARTILKTNNGKAKLGIPELDGVNSSYLKFLLSAELNAAWNGQDNAAAPDGTLGNGSYQGMTVNEVLHQAYLDRYNFSSAQKAYLEYLGADGENTDQSACLVQP